MFYTDVINLGNFILVRGVENGKRIKQRIPYKPKLYVRGKKPNTKLSSLNGEPLEEMEFSSIYEAREFCKLYRDVKNFTIYGNTRYEYAYISEVFGKHVDWDPNQIVVGTIDIEVGSENGFPEPSSAFEPITAITLHVKNFSIKDAVDGIYYVFGCGDFDPKGRKDVRYLKCDDEKDLITKFLKVWEVHSPDIITGWNIEFFDFPYLINRARRLFLEEEILKLSPWKKITDRESNMGGKKTVFFDICGVAMLDYISLYKKYSSSPNQESYRLEHIAQVELGETKLDYSEYENLYTLYTRDFQKFIDYNIKDVTLVIELNDKLQLLELAMTLAYDNKVNYGDVFSQVRMWDAIINNALRLKGIIIPPKKDSVKGGQYMGAYVKDPQIGMHDWVVSFDLDGLYPHLIMMYNLGPETLMDPDGLNNEFSSWFATQKITIETLLNQSIDTKLLKEYNVALTPNGQIFSRKKQGFLAELMESMYADRKKFKDQMISSKKLLEKTKDPEEIKNIEKRISMLNNLQLAKKVTLNSAYGAIGNEYFRFFDIRIAEAVTSSGQLAIRWIQKEINDYLNKLAKTTDVDFVIASDTDSIYLNLGPIIEQNVPNLKKREIIDVIRVMDTFCETTIQKFIEKSYLKLDDYVNAFSHKMKMKREALANKAIWTAKKHYMMSVYNNEGVEYTKPKLKIVGLEAIKAGSLPTKCRNKIKEAYNIIMTKDRLALVAYVDEYWEEFKNSPVEEIALPRGCNNLLQYSDAKNVWGFKTPFHVKGALMYNHLLKKHKLERRYPEIKEGEKIKYTYLKEPNTVQCNAISFPNSLPKEFELQQFIDYDTQFEKSFLSPLNTILDSIGWKLEETSSLDLFFA
jgi:DNA polymerase elongation subunit (family B)